MPGIRVIAGKAKGRRLKMVPGEGTRPIPDRVKESLFNIIGQDIKGASFLDLFAGTGSVAIEALSRGAASCLMIDNDRQAIRTIQENLTLTGFEAQAEVVRADSFTHLQSAPPRGFDYLFIAPPQYKQLWRKTLEAVDQFPGWLNPDAWVVAQIDPNEYTPLQLTRLIEFDQRKYGNTLLVFYEFPGK
jgi:16S rRNA (guanine(966)-N(2))-methyltransferase RsmD